MHNAKTSSMKPFLKLICFFLVFCFFLQTSCFANPVLFPPIQISGTVTEASPVKVRVNGFLASLNGNQFTLDNYGLIHGSNTLTAKAVDSSGNASTHQITVTYNSNNPATSYAYDNNGNLTSKQSDTVLETFTYDYENRLKAYVAPGQSASYAYNGQGQRISKTVNGTTTSYYYDGPELVKETTGANSIYYIHSNRVDEVVCDSRGYSYHSDGLGSVSNLTDNAGLNANTYNYKAFGSIRSQSGTVANNWRYTGRQYDSESGLYFYRNRYYDAGVGRFITQDPSLTLNANSRLVPYLLMNNLSSPAELQKYLYCVNNPVNRTDPLGLWYIDINFSGGWWGGGTGGIMIGPEGIYAYAGGGVVSPGGSVSITWSPQDPSTGWNVGAQGAAGISYQKGYSFKDKSKFWEIGVGLPAGFSVTGYYVDEPWQWPWKRSKPKSESK